MAAAAPVAPADLGTPTKGVQPLRAGQGHSFLWRRLHSLSGIIPIGAFLVEHIVSNFEIWNGPLAYAQQVKLLNSLPLVRVLEWGLIFLPLAFHALYGVFISFRGRANVNVYPWASNWMYIMQRVTGLIALVYIVQHVIRQRFFMAARRLAAGASRHGLPQGAARVAEPVDVRHLLHRDGRYLLALCLWHLALRRQVGDYTGRPRTEALGLRMRLAGRGAYRHGADGSIWAAVYKYPNAPLDVMPAQPAGVTLPAPSVAPPNSANPSQPGAMR